MKEHRAASVLRQAAALGVTALFLMPLLFLVAGSIRQIGPGDPVPELLPGRPSLDGYRLVFDHADLVRQTFNSAVVALIVTPLSVAVAAAAGFAMTRLSDRPRRLLIAVSFAAALMPLSTLIVGRFLLFRSVELLDSYVPMVASALIGWSPFHVLLFYVAFRRIPAELFDAATLDGASPVRMFVRVGLPSVRPFIVAVGLVTFAASWGNVLEPLVYISDEDLFTLPLGLRSLASLDLPHQPIMLAGAVLSLLIPVALLIAVHHRAVELPDED